MSSAPSQSAVSVAIETSSRQGGVALGVEGCVVGEIAFPAGSRHATQLLSRIDELLAARSLRPADIDELYVSVGPGSFTGVRIGVTVARTLAQALPTLRLVAVPSPWAVAEGAADLDWRHLVVLLDAREGRLYVERFERRGEQVLPAPGAGTLSEEEFLQSAPRPALLLGEGLRHHPLDLDEQLTRGPQELDLPSAGAVWRVGHRLARRGEFDDPRQLLPIYARRPEAVRLWEQRHGGS